MDAGVSGPEPGTSHLAEVLARVLDRGIVIDAEVRVHVAGLIVAGIEARIVVASIETYLEYADALTRTAPASWRSRLGTELPMDVQPWTIDPQLPSRPRLPGANGDRRSDDERR